MNKQEIYEYLSQQHIWYEVTEHKAVYNMEDLSDVEIPYPQADAKNLFVRDNKKQNYYLITVRGNQRVDLKAFRKANGTRPLSFASEEDLTEKMGLQAGSVTPLGVLNDETCSVKVFVDAYFLENDALIGVHPNENTATIWMKTEDLLRIIRAHGNEVHCVSMQKKISGEIESFQIIIGECREASQVFLFTCYGMQKGQTVH